MSDADSLDAFLAELLSDQQRLQTPVIRAAVAHSLQPSAWRAQKFRELVPLSAPGPGERYAFEVDLDSCSGCKACVAGCHSLNGLDDNESFRDVGLITFAAPATPSCGPSCSCTPPSDQNINSKSEIVTQTITSACHHCADPACLNGCPVLAYEQDPATGIVRHLDDQCIGCSYCVLKCPYDVPKYNARLGIVRKCDLCHGRLAEGEAPACAQACPTQAIRVVVIKNEQPPHGSVEKISHTTDAYTRPATRYVSKKSLPAFTRAAHADTLRPQPAHLPLVFLLVFTQLALGLLLASFAESQISNFQSQISIAAAALYFAGLAASVLHLGQPLRAWRVFLNLRKSWLSREAVLLGAAAPFVALAAASALGTSQISDLGSYIILVAIALAAAGVFCSAALYIDTRRRFWRVSNTSLRMGGSVLVSALAFVAPLVAAPALALKLVLEQLLLRASPVSARLHVGPLRPLHLARLALGLVALPAFFLHPVIGFTLFALGELAERTLYFRAVDAPKMPGFPA